MEESDYDRAERFLLVLRKNMALFEKLDEAMASPERIREDTYYCAGFVSGIDIIYTAEEVIDRAIKIIKEKK
jgi:hypothetical protein